MEIKDYKIDDSGNIGHPYKKSRINITYLNSTVDPLTILQSEDNKDIFFKSVESLNAYVIGSNVIRINGQKIPFYKGKKIDTNKSSVYVLKGNDGVYTGELSKDYTQFFYLKIYTYENPELFTEKKVSGSYSNFEINLF